MENEFLKKKALKKIRAKEKEKGEDIESRLNFDDNSNIFTKEVKYLTNGQYFLTSLKNLCIKAGLFIWGWIKTIFFAFVNIFVTVYKIVRYGSVKIYEFFKELCHKFKYNDKWGRLSYIVFGAGSLAHKQYANGILYLLFQIGYIVFFALVGVHSIQGIWNLGVMKVNPNWSYADSSPDFQMMKDNSLLLLIGGLFTLLSIFVFIFIWLKSINAGYNNHRINKFNDYKKAHEKLIPLSNRIDGIIKGLYANHYAKKGTYLIKSLESGVSYSDAKRKYFSNNFYISKRRLSLRIEHLYNEYLALADNKFEKEYTKYIYKETIKNSLKYYKNYYTKLNKKEKYDVKYNIIALRHEIIVEDLVKQNKLSEVDNILLKHKKKEHKVEDKSTFIAKSLSDASKSYTPFASTLSRINYNTYAKFNEYFIKVSSYNTDLKFYNAYADLVRYYDTIGQESEGANVSNAQKAVTLKESAEARVNEVNARYEAIYAKKAKILEDIKALRLEMKLAIKQADVSLKEDIEKAYTSKINKLDGQYNAYANDKLLKQLQSEEVKLIKKRAKDDAKYLKTNYTPDSYSVEETVNYMLVNYDFDYKYAKANVTLVANHLSSEEVQSRIDALEAQKASYIEKYSDTRFVGRSKTFKNQIKSLFNDKFHITILTLPIIGATLFSIIPLLFSILIAFTNFDKQHLIGVAPFQWTGLETFIKMFEGNDPIYGAIGAAIGQTFIWTFVWAIFATFSNYFLGIIVALMINKDGIKLKKLWRTMFVLTIAVPQFISLATIAKMLADGGTGVLANIYQTFTGTPLRFASSVKDNALVTKIIIIVVNIWVGIPYTILSTTGILMNIPKDLYESSRIDGAGPATQFFKITMPYILFVTGPSLITSFIGNFNNFGVIYFLTGGRPARTGGTSTIAPGYTDLFITYIYTLVTGDTYKYYNVASCLGIIIFIVCSFISIIMYNKTGAVAKEDQFQ